MKAVAIDSFGSINDLHIRDVATPEPLPNEVLIRIQSAGVNPVDWKICEGHLKDFLPYKFPLILGWDAAGIIEKVGSKVTSFKKGDEVYAYCRKPVVESGTFAEFIAVDEKSVASRPKNISFAESSAIPLAGLTAWQCLFDAAKIKTGDHVLIQAGAGGVGSFAIQFAKWKGAKVYTTASEKHHSYVKNLGADVAIDYTKENFAKVLPEKMDAVFDFVGGRTLRESFPTLKKDGVIVSIVNSNIKELAKDFPLRAEYVFVAPNGPQLKEIAGLIEKGTVKPVATEEFAFDKVVKALENVKGQHTKGKIVLKIT